MARQPLNVLPPNRSKHNIFGGINANTEPALRVGVFFAALAINLTVAYGADRPIKIGVLTDMNGPYSAITGKGSVTAAQLAIEDFTALVPDRSVELVVADHMQKPDVGASIARKWYDNEGVDAIFDGAGSSVALAIIDIAKSRKEDCRFLRSDITRSDRR